MFIKIRKEKCLVGILTASINERKKKKELEEANKEVPNWALFLAPRSINCSPFIVHLAVIVLYLSPCNIGVGAQAEHNVLKPG